MSVRSHSSGIVDDINKEFKETGIRLTNLARDAGDTSMHYDNASASMKNEEVNSHRSGSLSSDRSNK